MITDGNRIRKYIDERNRFGEAVIEDIRWRQYGLVIEFTLLRPMYESRGAPSHKLEWERVAMEFHIVQELTILNAFNRYQCAEPERVNWGHNEISLLSLENDPAHLAPYKDLPMQFLHLVFQWEEDEHRIDIVFHGLKVSSEKVEPTM